jgi:hypothetical protein
MGIGTRYLFSIQLTHTQLYRASNSYTRKKEYNKVTGLER